MEWNRDPFVISDVNARVDRDLVHRFLRDESYWSQDVPRDVVDRSIDHSLCFCVFDRSRGRDEQVGFARVISGRCPTRLARWVHR